MLAADQFGPGRKSRRRKLDFLQNGHYPKPMYGKYIPNAWLLLSVASSVSAFRQGWPQWRGPNRDGIRINDGCRARAKLDRVVHDGNLYVRDQDVLLCYDV